MWLPVPQQFETKRKSQMKSINTFCKNTRLEGGRAWKRPGLLSEVTEASRFCRYLIYSLLMTTAPIALLPLTVNLINFKEKETNNINLPSAYSFPPPQIRWTHLVVYPRNRPNILQSERTRSAARQAQWKGTNLCSAVTWCLVFVNDGSVFQSVKHMLIITYFAYFTDLLRQMKKYMLN